MYCKKKKVSEIDINSDPHTNIAQHLSEEINHINVKKGKVLEDIKKKVEQIQLKTFSNGVTTFQVEPDTAAAQKNIEVIAGCKCIMDQFTELSLKLELYKEVYHLVSNELRKDDKN